jgi:hypothetical protein
VEGKGNVMIKFDLRNDDKKFKKIRSDKRIRVNPSLSPDDMEKLKLLALACENIPKTQLAQELLHFCLNNPNVIEYFQTKKHPCKQERFRIYPIIENGNVTYSSKYD